MRRRLLIAVVFVACGPPAAAVVKTPPAPTAATIAPPGPAATVTGAVAASVVSASHLPVQVDLGPGFRCTFLFQAEEIHDAQANTRYIKNIATIRVEPSTDCAGATLFDRARDTVNAWNDGDAGHYPLPGGFLRNPGEIGESVSFFDANFDGYRDLGVLSVPQGGHAYPERWMFWIYEPATRSFRRNERLESLVYPKFDPTTKTISDGMSSDALYWASSIAQAAYKWNGRDLEEQERTVTRIGATPDGDVLPEGFARWETRYQRRGGVLVKVFDGPVK